MSKRVGARSGFTIVELLIVIVIIGILAAITIVAYNGIQDRAQFAKAQSDVGMVNKKIALFNVDTGTYPTSISDCPTPAATNLCLTPSNGDSYTYQSIAAGGTGYTVVTQPSYEITASNDREFLYVSPAEKTSNREFMQYTDLAPMIDKYGLIKYQLSFDIKSASAAAKTIQVYFQNGSTARYGNLQTSVNVTTAYTHQTITFTPALSNAATAQSMLAFYGVYDSGNIPTVKNIQFQIAP
jgi:prepilin-type N-terminal cleavage/methylation domain-containing protein